MRRLAFGDVVLVEIPSHVPRGREQEGSRPAMVVGIPERIGTPRFPMLVAAPMTTQEGKWADLSPGLYPRVRAGEGGVAVRSTILLDQMGAIDAQRLKAYLGTLPPPLIGRVHRAIQQMCSPS